ncbi:galactosyldiacylglycerol synthase [Bacillus sp. FJAT-49711]|uniref:MGDG synthase family glycosyltransferase n=1 Tax=Bacillus sp. FJAT-49711 TaxID=2833585 RepID=UPI001BC90DB9|nr:glycosyltransferase [Bacillus sp. FJAT-49711]MBS4219865.1 galactosyldiacylglycerol synthase [Bacillus sp. FJAT-49711]
MKKILFFPLLRMPSGHHQVADTIANYIQKRNPTITCKKIDLLSTWNPIVESVVTRTYLEWIHHFPKSYAKAYRHMAHSTKSQRSYKYYEILFMKKMKQILREEKPDLIICTHGFPSYILSKLKMKSENIAPVINVYTDFFINDVWGKKGIDYHFVPNQKVRKDLIQQNNISEEQIFITGIPIAEQIEESIRTKKMNENYRILVSGGSVGLGNITDLMKQQKNDSKIEYLVLCGKNEHLFRKLEKLNRANIHPLPYISSREEMNHLYDDVDAIVTKPGGVTISEALKKRLPIFIHSALPGQEEINLTKLKELNLVHELEQNQSLSEQITGFFSHSFDEFQHSLKSYLMELKTGNPDDISNMIHSFMGANEERRIAVQ